MNAQDARQIINQLGLSFYKNSIHIHNQEIYFVSGSSNDKTLVKLYPKKLQDNINKVEVGQEIRLNHESYFIYKRLLNHEVADELRRIFPNLCPKPLGLKPAIGLGDRLGIATPGHIEAVREFTLSPVLAQQSIREMKRIERTPQNVMDDAFWGVFISGWENDWGADADHLKDKESIKTCIDAGFTMFTIDIGDFVDNNAYAYSLAEVNTKIDEFPWEKIEISRHEFNKRYADKNVTFDGDLIIQIDEESLQRSFIKYGYAIIQAVDLFRFLDEKMGSEPYDFEVSIDETDIPTSPLEHYLIVSELMRLKVRITSIAPRFVGKFEKGVDYIGNIENFRTELVKHFKIMKILGPYKISLHSGSDKFSIYPIASEVLSDYFHLKTAGTSYLEALKVIAEFDMKLFKEIATFCLTQYAKDRKSYYVSAHEDKFPNPDNFNVISINELFNNFDFREIMHVTYGSVLTEKNLDQTYKYKDRFYQIMYENEKRYFEYLSFHIKRHINPFATRVKKSI